MESRSLSAIVSSAAPIRAISSFPSDSNSTVKVPRRESLDALALPVQGLRDPRRDEETQKDREENRSERDSDDQANRRRRVRHRRRIEVLRVRSLVLDEEPEAPFDIRRTPAGTVFRKCSYPSAFLFATASSSVSAALCRYFCNNAFNFSRRFSSDALRFVLREGFVAGVDDAPASSDIGDEFLVLLVVLVSRSA
jgi:hypothetical protein